MTLNLPNLLTTLRLLAAPGLAVMFLYFDRPYADWFALLLFVSAALTDWFDGYLARAWKQETKLGAMLDPIADKAMVVIALMVIVGYSSMSPWLVLPTTVILFREVFVSGLREYLGDRASALRVTRLAKFKTSAQMIAIAVLFAQGQPGLLLFVCRMGGAQRGERIDLVAVGRGLGFEGGQLRAQPGEFALGLLVASARAASGRGEELVAAGLDDLQDFVAGAARDLAERGLEGSAQGVAGVLDGGVDVVGAALFDP